VQFVRRALRLGLFVGFAQILVLLGLEMLARASLLPSSGLGPALSYGLDSKVEAFPGVPLRLVSVMVPPVDGGTTPAGVDPEELLVPFEAREGGRLTTAFAFGGSTTAGRHCSMASSSWPSELAALVPGLAVLNYAVPGSNTDRALERMALELGQATSDFPLLARVRRPEFYESLSLEERRKLEGPVPEIMFWANWINERNVLMHAGRPPGRLPKPSLGRQFQQGDGAVWLHRLHVTLASRSVLWLRLSRWGDAWVGHVEPSAWEEVDPAQPLEKRKERDISFAVGHTLENLKKAHLRASEAGSRLVVVRPPISWPLMEQHKGRDLTALTHRWNYVLFEGVVATAADLGIPVLDPHGKLEEAGVPVGAFCDGVHMTREGHRRIAQAMLTEGGDAGLF
jgi:hypothetical protein